jgi:hypothetical protein
VRSQTDTFLRSEVRVDCLFEIQSTAIDKLLLPIFLAVDTPLVYHITGRVQSEMDDIIDIPQRQFGLFLPSRHDALHLADQLVIWIRPLQLF